MESQEQRTDWRPLRIRNDRLGDRRGIFPQRPLELIFGIVLVLATSPQEQNKEEKIVSLEESPECVASKHHQHPDVRSSQEFTEIGGSQPRNNVHSSTPDGVARCLFPQANGTAYTQAKKEEKETTQTKAKRLSLFQENQLRYTAKPRHADVCALGRK